MDYTNVLQLLDSYIKGYKRALSSEELIGVEPWQTLLEEITGVYNLLNSPTICPEIDNHAIVQKSKITQYGVETIVTSLYEEGFKPTEISNQLQSQGLVVSSKEIKEWLNDYSIMPIVDKATYQYGSVFDTQTQMQNIFNKLNYLLAEVEDTDRGQFRKTSKQEVILQYMTELRMTLKDATSLAATVSNLEAIESYKQVVLEEVGKVDPIVRQKIIRRLQEAKILLRNILPS